MIPLALALIAASASVVRAAPALGDQVVYRSSSTESRTAVVTAVVSGTTIDLVAFSDGDDYGDGNQGSTPAAIYRNVVPGTGIGEYTIGTSVADLVASLGYLQTPTGSSPSLTLGGSGVQLSATRPVLLTVRGTASMVSTLAGGQAYTVELRCDAGSTPTTVVDDAAGSLAQTVGLSVTLTVAQSWKLVQLVPAGQYCRVVQASGAATLSVTGAIAAAL